MTSTPQAGSIAASFLELSRRQLLLGAAGAAVLATAGGAALVTPARATILDDHVTLSRTRLDALAAASYTTFNEGKVLPGFDAVKHAAAHDVELRRITTFTQVPESGETVKVSGLLALPAGATGPLPVVSWQHGTILSFTEVPSALTRAAEPDYVLQDNVDSQETLFNLHRFAGHGYAVIAADYLGKGPYRGLRPEAYAVKEASTRTILDILNAGLEGMQELGVQPAELFLNGWSQGALNTQWLCQALQTSGVPVRATGAASPFNDLSDSLDFWTGRASFAQPESAPYPPRPRWLGLALAIVLASYEHYYGLDGLVATMVRPAYLPMVRKFLADYDPDIDPASLPMPEDMLIEGFERQFSGDAYSRFLRLVGASRASYFEYSNPIRLYYGLADEAIHPEMARRPVIAGGRMMDGAAVPGASHRATFLASLYGEGDVLQGRPNLLSWFNSLRET